MHPHNGVGIAVFDRRKAFRIGSLAGPVPRDRRGHVECLMRALGVVDRTPCVEGMLRAPETDKGATTEQLGLQGAMKPLILAVGLRMGWAAVRQPHAKADQ